jgi:hypothetical protein
MSMANVEVSLRDSSLAMSTVAEEATRTSANRMRAAEGSTVLGTNWDINVGESCNMRILNRFDLNTSGFARLPNEIKSIASTHYRFLTLLFLFSSWWWLLAALILNFS